MQTLQRRFQLVESNSRPSCEAKVLTTHRCAAPMSKLVYQFKINKETATYPGDSFLFSVIPIIQKSKPFLFSQIYQTIFRFRSQHSNSRQLYQNKWVLLLFFLMKLYTIAPLYWFNVDLLIIPAWRHHGRNERFERSMLTTLSLTIRKCSRSNFGF